MSSSHCQSKHQLCNFRDTTTIAKVFEYMREKYGIQDEAPLSLSQLQVMMNEIRSERDENGRYGDWIQTFTGRRFYPLDPRPEEFSIVDIAWSLSNAVRFCGHVSQQITVAQHSILVSRYCDPPDALWGLVHDTSEFAIADVSTPVKKSKEMTGYRKIEKRIMDAACVAFGLPLEQPDSVHRADKAVLASEVRNFMQPIDPDLLKYIEQFEDLNLKIEVMDQRTAFISFLNRYEELSGKKCR